MARQPKPKQSTKPGAAPGLRIIAGQHRGRRLAVPTGQDVRPTSDRARESLFNILTNGYRRNDGTALLSGALVLDGFAGSGALGLEALSRGASQVFFAEKDPAALACLRQNLAALATQDSTGQAKILAGAIERLPQADRPADLLLLDPPYGYDDVLGLLARLKQSGWLDQNSLLVLERDAKAKRDRQSADEEALQSAGLSILDRRDIGRNAFYFLELS